jgi:hypothetical protein
LLVVLLAACSSSHEGPVFPAYAPSLGAIGHHGGAVLHTPAIVTVTFEGDPLAADLEEMGRRIAASATCPRWPASTACAAPTRSRRGWERSPIGLTSSKYVVR